ncbi:hypothetical protein CEE36_04455 [candidate division TA06 bacterium B3_TA06]|uniref:WWE domain-containing protein n=1 Tax=candidate division TA06 bacterium B3_TA06 TaxID=2012487 RepID=A0A532V7W1_UNCT6|nr:MAG: hypothetical protein CEE36_04455 [candidate division TA06 bacterium B3_TA06]
MKKILLISMLLIVGAAFAASTMPTQTNIGPTSALQALTIYCWEGTATAVWDRFEIFYHKETGEMWGTWYRGENEGGWIEGFGEPDPAGKSANWYIGSGSFGGDDSGKWKGLFKLNDECRGDVWNLWIIGEFYGWSCE